MKRMVTILAIIPFSVIIPALIHFLGIRPTNIMKGVTMKPLKDVLAVLGLVVLLFLVAWSGKVIPRFFRRFNPKNRK